MPTASSSTTTTSTMDDKINEMIGSTNLNNNSHGSIAAKRAYFITSRTYNGTKEGYYFGTTKEYGTGYYLDSYADNNRTSNNKKRKYNKSDEDEDNDNNEKTKKSVSFGATTIKTITTTTKEELLKQAESNASPYAKILTSTKSGIKIAVQTLQKSIEQNQIEREMCKSNPERYFDSEISLYEETQCWKSLASMPASYKYLIDNTSWLDLLLELLILPHENIDILCVIINIFVELLDLSLLNGNDDEESDQNNIIEENLKWFSQACAYWKSSNAQEQEKYDFITIISNVLVKLSLEKKEMTENKNNDIENDVIVQKGIEDVLTLLDTFLEMENTYKFFDATSKSSNESSMIIIPKIASTKLIPWIFEQIGNNNTYTKEKSQYSEFLFTLLQIETTFASASSTNNITKLKTLSSCNNDNIDGIEMLLQGVAPYRKKDPSISLDEVETLENYINSLSTILLFSSTTNAEYKDHFIKLQGIELMVHCLKSLKHVSYCSLKVIESCFFFTSLGSFDIAKQSCEIFITNNGFKYLFPIFMGRTIPKPSISSNVITNKKSKKEWLSTIEECCIQILCTMTRLLVINNNGNNNNEYYERYLVKFIENDYEKCNRLIELTLKYDVKMRKAENKFYKSEEAEYYYEQNAAIKSNDANNQDDIVDVDLLAFEYKLKHGGDIFHRLGAILAFACVGSKRCHEFVLDGLKIHRSGIGGM